MNWKPVVEAIIYVAEEPVSAEQVATALADVTPESAPGRQEVHAIIEELMAEYRDDARGMEIKEVAGGFKMATKPEHHEAVRQFARTLKPPIKLSLPALETLAMIAYRQPVTVPEIQEVRGVNASGVIKTLLEKKLVTTAGRKDVMGRPILYKTTREFLVQFGLKDLSELPSLKEFEELSRAALGAAPVEAPPEPAGEPSSSEAVSDAAPAEAQVSVESGETPQENEGERAGDADPSEPGEAAETARTTRG